MKGKDLKEVIAAGSTKLSSLPVGGGSAAPAAAAATTAAPAKEEAKEEKGKEKKKEEEPKEEEKKQIWDLDFSIGRFAFQLLKKDSCGNNSFQFISDISLQIKLISLGYPLFWSLD